MREIPKGKGNLQHETRVIAHMGEDPAPRGMGSEICDYITSRCDPVSMAGRTIHGIPVHPPYPLTLESQLSAPGLYTASP